MRKQSNSTDFIFSLYNSGLKNIMWDDFRESQRHEMLDILTRSSLSISAIAKAQLFQSWDFALDEYIKKYNLIMEFI